MVIFCVGSFCRVCELMEFDCVVEGRFEDCSWYFIVICVIIFDEWV